MQTSDQQRAFGGAYTTRIRTLLLMGPECLGGERTDGDFARLTS